MNSANIKTSDIIAAMPQKPYEPLPTAADSWSTAQPSTSHTTSRLPTIIAIVIALIAVAVAIGAWFRPIPESTTTPTQIYSEQEITEAKEAVCGAFEKAFKALTVNSLRAGDNPTTDLSVIANSRITIHSAGTYLLTILNNQPATPKTLSEATKNLAIQYGGMVLDQIGEADEADLESDYLNADSLTSEISKACNDRPSRR